MKIKHYFGLAVIAAMTASCSSNEDLGTAGSGTGTNEAGVGYATFTINLPTAMVHVLLQMTSLMAVQILSML